MRLHIILFCKNKETAKIKKTSRVSKTVSNIRFNDYSGQEKYMLLIHIHG